MATARTPPLEPTPPEPTPPGPNRPGSTLGQRLRTRWRRWGAGGDGARQPDSGPRGRPPVRTAFVLAGGGSRGAVQVGMLAELVHRGIRADRVFGASVGAINGAAYAGRPDAAGMQHLADAWLRIRGTDIFPRGTFDGPWAFFQKRPAVHANTGLRAIVEAGIDYPNIEDSEIPLEVVTTSLTDGRERWISSGPAVEAILASSAIPSIFPAVTIDGDVLVDGGVVNNVPISRAIEAGCNRIYVLLCGPLHYRPRSPKRPAEAALTAFFVAVQARFVRELASLPPGIEVVVFSGGGEPEGQYRDFSATATLMEEGRAEVAAVLDRFTGTLGEDGHGPAEPGTATPPAAAVFESSSAGPRGTGLPATGVDAAPLRAGVPDARFTAESAPTQSSSGRPSTPGP